ncbi:hypothetical protein U1Q18_044100 [Sarracenia purpurea var. burkii]
MTFTEVRKTIIGDVGSVRRVFDFLEAWGLINYSPGSASKPHLKWEDKESKSNTTEPAGGSAGYMVPKRRLCSGCKTVCSIACFASDKYDLTLCARCYVRGNYRVGVNSTDFKRVEISEEIKTDWTDKETLQLLEAIMHFGDDWKKVAKHVSGRSERECVTRFINLPFGEQFVGFPESTEVDDKFSQMKDQDDADFRLSRSGRSLPNKRICPSPLADASNPIIAQAALLSALGGVEAAEVAAHAAVRTLSEFSHRTIKESHESLSGHAKQLEPDAISNNDMDTASKMLEGGRTDFQFELEGEERELERAISCITDVQLKDIEERISYFEGFESQMEREWDQLQQMKNLVYLDQLTLLFNQSVVPKAGEGMHQKVETE